MATVDPDLYDIIEKEKNRQWKVGRTNIACNFADPCSQFHVLRIGKSNQFVDGQASQAC